MTPKQRAENYSRVFPQYPPLRYDDRWLDGFWVLGQNYRGSGLHGSYPPTYLDRIRAIFPHEFQGRVLHLCSGSLSKKVGGVRLDLSFERHPLPDVYGDAHQLPFPAGTFDLVVADIPYTEKDARKYGTPMVNRVAAIREAARVLKTGGHLIWLDIRKPMFRKKDLHWWSIIGVLQSTNHQYRAVTFYQRRKSDMSKLSTKINAAAEKIAAALAILMGEDADSVAEALKQQKANTKVRETGDDEDEDKPKRGPGRPKKGPKPPVEDEDEDDEDEKPAKSKKGPKPPADDDDDEDEDEDEAEGADIPKDAALAELDRAALKKLALANGIEAAGKNREDLTKLLQEKRDGGGKPKGKVKPAADDDDEDDDEKPAKGKKTAKEDADEDKPEEDDYPKVKIMKADIEAFCKLNKQLLTDMGFFGGKPKKGVQKAEHTYDEIMEDVDLIKEAWADNVWPEIQSGKWKKKKAEADAMEDEDDDE